ncbi:hypothetical protein GCM10011354_14140 [Egicoccus halophilus]|uniref:Uncharacterized protein n=1 Tax=Egicoccus halophilus TaxID=1670830 RepID=A0A8J3A9P6_9ACTN|nr:hypothetical protein GCM10011354_14140 [Egicoccus halophilus]
MLVVAGPDGSGKSHVASVLCDAAAPGPVLHLHHRPRVLPGKTRHEGPVTDPHRDPPYGPGASALKLVYLYLDYVLGWLLRVRPVVRAGGTVVLERGWEDLAVDPRRYRLTARPRLHRLLGLLLPRPDRSIVLAAPVEELLARKAELPAEELARQNARWRRLARSRRRMLLWDARQPPEDVLPFAFERAATAAAQWVALPTARDARFVLPRTPRRASLAGLRIHRPVSPRALAMWAAAGTVTRVGALRVLTPTRPAAWVLDAVGDLVPPGGTVATARSNHAGRALVLVLDRHARAQLVVKVSADEVGQAQLAREAANLQRFGPLLPAPLWAPELRHADPGRLATAPVRWRVCADPWRLHPDVAAALGAFHRASGRGAGGNGHGDMAPWNLLPTRDGWCLVDWEVADDERPPFEDVFHFLVQGSALLGRPDLTTVLHGLDGGGWVGACLRAYADAAGVRVGDAPVEFRRYLEASGATLDPTRADARRGVSARRAFLEALERRY